MTVGSKCTNAKSKGQQINDMLSLLHNDLNSLKHVQICFTPASVDHFLFSCLAHVLSLLLLIFVLLSRLQLFMCFWPERAILDDPRMRSHLCQRNPIAGILLEEPPNKVSRILFHKARYGQVHFGDALVGGVFICFLERRPPYQKLVAENAQQPDVHRIVVFF